MPTSTAQRMASSTVLPSPSPSSTEHVFVTAASTPAPTATLVRKTEDGDILTPKQKENLYQASLQYVAHTEAEGIAVSRSMGYLENDGHPSNVCGPLAIAELMSAGLLNPYLDLHDFWLLDTRGELDQLILRQTFPADEFSHFKTAESIADFDFTAFPLKAGDFVYLYAGKGGTFEHMFTVTRVDDQKRAYSVTNLNTVDGYKIEEVLLYDPGKPGVGMFYEWTDYRNYKIGLTGFGGFEVWRFAAPVLERGQEEEILAAGIDAMIERQGGDWFILISEVGSAPVYARGIRQRIHIASVIKVATAMLFFKTLDSAGMKSYPDALKGSANGYSYEQLLRDMLVNSEEYATGIIYQQIQNRKLNIEAVLKQWGIERMDFSARQSTVRDVGKIFEGLYSAQFVSEEARDYLLELMSIYTPDDDHRLGKLRQFLPEHSFFNKRGTLTDEFLIVADAAIVLVPVSKGTQPFLMAAFAYQGKNATTFEKLEQGIEEIAMLFWKYSRQL